MASVARGLLFDGFGRTPWMGVKFTKPVYTQGNKATVTSRHIQRCINILVKKNKKNKNIIFYSSSKETLINAQTYCAAHAFNFQTIYCLIRNAYL
jgi:hypothetical protein